MSSRTEVAEHYYNDTVKDQVTDALFIILSFRISADHIKPLAECLSCSVHPESNSAESSNDKSVSSTALQILWDWRNKEALHANCRTLVKAFLTSETLPTDITEFVISQLEGQNQVSVTSFNYSKWDEPAEVKKMRLNFAQAYIKVFEGITQKRISEWLNVANDTNIHEFILRRCNWLNYDLLEELDNDLGDKKVFGIYVKQYKSIMKKIQVFRIPPNSIPTVPVSSRCIFTIFFQPSMQNYSGSVLHEINAIDETNLCIDVSIQKRMLHKVTNKKWEDQNLISYDSLVNATSYSLTAECADGLDNYCSSPIDQADDESWVDFVPDIDATQLTLSTFDDTKFSAAVEDVDIVGDLVVNLNIGPKLEISMEEFKRIILNQKVPVALCLVAVMGLPDCNKTSILESILRENIKLKETATRNFEEYMTRKKNPDGLSIYELCVLGGKPYDQYSWSFATERYGAIFSILCGLVRHVALAKSDIKSVEFLSDGHVSQNKLVDDHFKWLMGKAAKQLKDISKDEKKEALFLNGLTLANIMDVGVNKALYDFLPIMLSFCRSHLRLVFFSLERDGPKLNEVPDLSADHYSRRSDNRLALTLRSRLNCILHFATLGHNPKQKEDDSKRTFVVASSNSQSVVAGSSSQLHKAATDKIQEEAEKLNIKKFVSNVALVSINDADSLKSAKKEITEFIMKDQIFQKTLPLKWIFLRSLVISAQQKEGDMKTMILRKIDIYDAAAKEIGMDEEEFENFLVTFTDFGSILYMPQFRALRDIVVVDIWEFVRFLNELIYPKEGKKWYKDLTTYGIIKISDASEILKKYVDIFMKIIITFGMAAFINREKAYLNGRFLTEVCYYLPSARINKRSPPSDHTNDYAFLEIESANFPANIQASISHEILKKPNFYLIGNESFNTSQFGYRPPRVRPIQITMVYGANQTKLIFQIKDASTGMHDCVQACKGIIEACCDSLNRMANQI
uniref:Death domain-containing protein n=1 Tax=Amphimedon queenslandica TaxID=400682 RepID=A0A1X7UVR8_AMPQE